ncbi:MAG: fumarylacetoacetate hydrolase family protein [Halobacteria archaeon]
MRKTRVEIDGEVYNGEVVDADVAVDVDTGVGEDVDEDVGGKDEFYGGTTVNVDGSISVVGEDCTLLAPSEPSAMYCVGRNYVETLDQMDYDRPERPDFFIKPPVSVHPPGAPVGYPGFTDELTYAGELAVVIGEKCKDIDADIEAVDGVIEGFTIMNDLDALDQDGRTARKAFDGSGPLGPWIETEVSVSDVREGIEMETYVGGEKRQSASTEQMIFDVAEIISFLSRRFTFHPGDVVAFGSPSNPGLVETGDEVVITYDGVGTLYNEITETPR